MFDNPTDEVLRRLGRNLVIFQQAESLLKRLLCNHNVAGTFENFADKHQKHVEKINRTTLGNLVETYKNEVLQDAGEDTAYDPANGEEALLRFRFSVSIEDEHIESMRAELEAMKNERNQLVHHFLPRWQPGNDEVMQATLTYLDEQRQRVMPILDHLKATTEAVEQSHEAMRLLVQSGEFDRHYKLFWLQGSPLVTFMRDVANQVSRKDGWTYLAWAGKLAFENIPDELQDLKGRYGHKTLKKMLNASELFDVFDEPLPNGKFRTLYRPKSTVCSSIQAGIQLPAASAPPKNQSLALAAGGATGKLRVLPRSAAT